MPVIRPEVHSAVACQLLRAPRDLQPAAELGGTAWARLFCGMM